MNRGMQILNGTEYDGQGAAGINCGEMGMLLAEGRLQLAPELKDQKFYDEWDIILLLYANYKCDHGSDMKELFKEWGIAEWHWGWFNDARSRVRMINFFAGIYDEKEAANG